MYRFLLDEAEGVVVARLGPGASSAELASGALRAIVALDSAEVRVSFPRFSLSILEDDAEHYGPADRERIVQANRAIRHRTTRLLVTRSQLHSASLSVIKQRIDEGSKASWGTFRTVDEALATIGAERPGLHRVVRRLLAVLDESMHSAVLRSARPASTPPDLRRQST